MLDITVRIVDMLENENGKFFTGSVNVPGIHEFPNIKPNGIKYFVLDHLGSRLAPHFTNLNA